VRNVSTANRLAQESNKFLRKTAAIHSAGSSREGQVLEIQDEEDLEKLIEKDFERAVRLGQNEPSLKVVI